MKRPFLVLFLVGISLAVIVSLVVKKTISADKIEMVEIMISTKDQPAGSFFNQASYQWQSWPFKGLPSEAITKQDVDDFDGDFTENARLRRGLVTGEPVLKTAIVRPQDQGFLAAVLEDGKRAVSIPVKAETSVAGFVRPGDWVDVVLTYEVRLGSGVDKQKASRVVARHAAETVIEGVRVLAVDQNVGDQDIDATLGKTVTLEVTPEQAERVALAEKMGDLSLSLRGQLAKDHQNSTNFTSDIEIGRALQAARRASTSADVSKTVRVYNGASATVIKVIGRE